MAEAVANVARRVNATVEEGKDTLDLSNCQLISFPDGVFKVLATVLENIYIITLANNKLKAISSNFFSAFTQLRELDLQDNVLTKLPDKVGEMEHITSINLANNNFSFFPEKLTEIATLERIDLEGNSITELPLEKLCAMPALKWLNVKSNPLSSSTQSALQSPYNFEILITTE
ncbi:PREDICTED: leucine-rich repeat-containing protein 20 [Cyprinodon variegatus]|uniref:Leucine-rich repeat protein SHOC-2 n=1 Tax=Cyprinodon variegatus TaxID=28743 RepID=A0A3Q2CJ01_CYPVA|nr:PREDICTED: leucine-rich repeat-containing protein 20 [Cyprinodon variegatus]XP_015254980.1 PREDICTED: leucine-rich repeat-containing protein 20 [Cyprinodon variegatus]